MEHVIKDLSSAKSPLHWVAFTGILAIAIILRLIAFQGYNDNDPRSYSLMANDLAGGIFHISSENKESPIVPIRLGVYAPTAAVIKIFGLSEVTLVLYPFLVSILGCVLAYALARSLVSPLAGLIGLGALALLPYDIGMASVFFPDGIAAFWANLGVAFAYGALIRSKLRQSALFGFLGGVFFGVSWLCKESVVFLIPFVAILVFVLYRQSPWAVRKTCIITIGLGSITVLLAEAAFYAKIIGDPLFHLHAFEQNYGSDGVWFFSKSSPYFGWGDGSYIKALVNRLLFDGPKTLLFNIKFAFLPALALLGAFWAVDVRQRSLFMPAIWLISLLIMFNFMTSSLTSYKPLPLFYNYVCPIFLPSAILVGGFLASLLAGGSDYRVITQRRLLALVLIVFICGLSAVEVNAIRKIRFAQVERNLAMAIEKDAVIYTDHRTAANLVFFRTGLLLSSDSTTIPWEEVDQNKIPDGAYFFVNTNRINFLMNAYNYKIPDCIAKSIFKLNRVWTYGNAELYIVSRK